VKILLPGPMPHICNSSHWGGGGLEDGDCGKNLGRSLVENLSSKDKALSSDSSNTHTYTNSFHFYLFF
jgi:hypothetical protein